MLEKVSNLKKIINVFCMLSTDYCFPNFRGIKMLINLRMVLYVNEHFSVHFFWSLKKNKSRSWWIETSTSTEQTVPSPSVHRQFTDNFHFTFSVLFYARLVPVHGTAIKSLYYCTEMEKGHVVLFKWQWHIDSTWHSSLKIKY